MNQTADRWIEAKHRLGESIIWHAATQRIMWVDLLDPQLFIHDPAIAATRVHVLPFRAPIGSIVATTDPKRLIIAHAGGLALLDIETLHIEQYCDPEAGRADVIYNDMKVDRWGRLWVGTSHAKEQDPRGGLWCVQDRATFALADAGFAISNGPAFSLDGNTMYFNDSAGHKTLAYDIAPQNLQAQNRRTLITHAEADGLPDGIVVDAQDNLWTAQWGGNALLCFNRDGSPRGKINVPAVNVTTLCFAGPHLDHICITTATDGLSPDQLRQFPQSGCLFHINTRTVGVAEPLFRI